MDEDDELGQDTHTQKKRSVEKQKEKQTVRMKRVEK